MSSSKSEDLRVGSTYRARFGSCSAADAQGNTLQGDPPRVLFIKSTVVCQCPAHAHINTQTFKFVFRIVKTKRCLDHSGTEPLKTAYNTAPSSHTESAIWAIPLKP